MLYRSFYFMGKIYESPGETERASEQYQRFIRHEHYRERVDEALSKLGPDTPRERGFHAGANYISQFSNISLSSDGTPGCRVRRNRSGRHW